jgi:hypothetical protein
MRLGSRHPTAIPNKCCDVALEAARFGSVTDASVFPLGSATL